MTISLVFLCLRRFRLVPFEFRLLMNSPILFQTARFKLNLVCTCLRGARRVHASLEE